jgi:cytochrome c-type biogenesis protein
MSMASAPLLIAAVLAFSGGLLSFVSPCVLPLVPAYLGYLAGASLRADEPPARTVLLSHALAFVLGFATIFTVAGIAIGAFMTTLQAGLDVLRIIGGLAVVVLGLHTAGIVTIPLLYRQARLDGSAIKPGSVGSSFLVGVFFAAGWSPCVGVILTGIFALVTSQPAQAGLLFFIYSLGLGLPFVLAALLLGRFGDWMRRLNKHHRAVSLVSGAFLVLVGILLLTNTFALLAAWLPPIEPVGLGVGG